MQAGIVQSFVPDTTLLHLFSIQVWPIQVLEAHEVSGVQTHSLVVIGLLNVVPHLFASVQVLTWMPEPQAPQELQLQLSVQVGCVGSVIINDFVDGFDNPGKEIGKAP